MEPRIAAKWAVEEILRDSAQQGRKRFRNGDTSQVLTVIEHLRTYLQVASIHKNLSKVVLEKDVKQRSKASSG